MKIQVVFVGGVVCGIALAAWSVQEMLSQRPSARAVAEEKLRMYRTGYADGVKKYMETNVFAGPLAVTNGMTVTNCTFITVIKVPQAYGVYVGESVSNIAIHGASIHMNTEADFLEPEMGEIQLWQLEWLASTNNPQRTKDH